MSKTCNSENSSPTCNPIVTVRLIAVEAGVNSNMRNIYASCPTVQVPP